MTQFQTSDNFFVVGIGASAGGLKALEEFFENLPHDSGAAFVVIQHLAPDFKSMMTELLARHTQMPIRLAEDGLPLTPDSIYLIPPGQNLVVEDRKLHLTAQDRERHHGRNQPNFPIDIFFHSLAVDCQSKGIGVILSGTGSDGSYGLKAIHEQGGIAMVQTPVTAEFDEMPRSAIQVGIAVRVLAPCDLAQVIHRFVRSPLDAKLSETKRPQNPHESLDAYTVQRVITILANTTQIDFYHYKPSTLARRIQRRCMITGFKTLDRYIQHLEDSKEEQITLKSDLLISVTEFFRNGSAWQIIEDEVIPQLFEQVSPDKPIRIWVTACATGEEAYSLAILVDEARRRLNPFQKIKIFATDIDTNALDRASQGIYPASILHELSEERLNHYFTYRNNSYKVNRKLREMLFFSEHNLTKDAMFTQMHLVSCRNVLIYMQPSLQRQVLQSLHFSLAFKGILFLGESETLGSLNEEFDPLNRKWKLYQKRRDVRLPFSQNLEILSSQMPLTSRTMRLRNEPQFDPLLDEAFKLYLKNQAVTCLLVDRENSLLHVVTDSAEIMRVPQGRVTHDVTRMVLAELTLPLNIALHRSRQLKSMVRYTDIHLKTEAGHRIVQLQVTYHKGGSIMRDFMLVEIKAQDVTSTLQIATAFHAEDDITNHVQDLEHELEQTRENLQATIEEFETTIEEQQASKEEQQASNEELQSTNEELHSVNEELHTVNAEYQSKIQQLIELNTDLDNLLKNTNIGVIFLDATLNIRKFTDAAMAAVNIRGGDLGRPLAHLSHNLTCGDLGALVQPVITEQKMSAYEVQLKGTDTHLLMRIHPYLLDDQSAQGAVITFVDVTDLSRAMAAIKASEAQVKETNALLEQRVAERTANLESFSQGLRLLNRIKMQSFQNIEELWAAYLTIGQEIFGLEHGILSRVSGQTLTIQAVQSSLSALNVGDCMDFDQSYCKPVIEERATIAYQHVGALPEMQEHPAYLSWGLESCIATPIMVNGELYGTLTFLSSTPRPQEFRQYEHEVIELMAEGIGNAIEAEITQAELITSRERFELVLQGAGVGIWDWNIQVDTALISPQYRRLLGYEHTIEMEVITSEKFLALVHPGDREQLKNRLAAHFERQAPYSAEVRLQHKSGTYIWVRVNGQAVWNKDGQPVRMAGSVEDISDRKCSEVLQRQLRQELEQALSEEQQLAEITLKAINEAVVTTNEQGHVVYINPRAEQMMGCSLAEVQGRSASQVLNFVDESDGSFLRNPVDKALVMNQAIETSLHQGLVLPDGQQLSVESSVTLIQDSHDSKVQGAVLIIRDVGQSRALAKKLSWQATHDSLTQLFNRQEFEQKLEQALTAAQNENQSHVLCYLDLDQFKIVNDTCGHLAGDELLKQVTQLLKDRVRTLDVLARLGGDEFGLLLYQCPMNHAKAIAEDLRETINEFRFMWGEKYFRIGVTIGLAVIDANTVDVASALSAADAACYIAKDKGRNRVEIYKPDSIDVMTQNQHHHASVKLRRALDEGNLHLVRQPIVSSLTPIITLDRPPVFYELLLRMTEEDKTISPGAFIPAAERYGLAPEIDQWVIRHALRLIAAENQTLTSSQAGPVYTINLSGNSLNDESTLGFIKPILWNSDIDPQQICFEVTETAAIHNLASARKFIQAVKQWGCKFALDDFGTGMSCFGYLKELPIDFIKIDGQFVQDVAIDPTAYAMVEAIHRVSTVMGLQTIAECVETDATIQCLQGMGIHYLQGFGIGQPEAYPVAPDRLVS